MLRSLLLTIAAMLSLSACAPLFPAAEDITHIELMETLAVDSGDNGLLTITASGGKRSAGEGESQPPIVITANGLTVADTCLTIRTAAEGRVSYSHLLDCLIGEDMAKSVGVEPIAGYLERDYETRMSTRLFLVSGLGAGELLQQATTPDNAVGDRLDTIARDLPLRSQAWPYTLKHLLSDLHDNGCALLPVVELDKEGETPEICPAGLAWLKDGKLAGQLDEVGSLAACIVTGHSENAMLEVTLDGHGQEAVAAVRLTSTRCELEPVWTGSALTGINVTVRAEADLSDLQGELGGYDAASLVEGLEGAVSRHLEEELGQVIALSQRKGADFLHLRRELAVKCPRKYQELEAQWEEWFPKAKVTVGAQTQVKRSYDMKLE